ncbi:MAG: amino acid permease, partial [Thermoleophilaceae bacterium]
EGSSVHPERGGAATFARYAFNELWSFVAGWAILLDYLIVMALAALSIAHYVAALWGGTATGPADELVAVAAIAWVGWVNVRGISADRIRLVLRLTVVNVLLLGAVAVCGLALSASPEGDFGAVDLGLMPTWEGLVFATVAATVAITGIEAASGLAGEITPSRGELRRVVLAVGVSSLVVLVGVSLVAVALVPAARAGDPAVLAAPLVALVSGYEPAWLADGLRAAMALVGGLVLLQAVNANMLGLSRLTYSLATHRQIPVALGRLHTERSTPFVAIVAAAAVAALLAATVSAELLFGLFAFGAMLAFTIAQVAIIRMRFTEPDARRAFVVPLSVRVGRGSVPVPTALGVVASVGALVGVLVVSEGARIAGPVWMVLGIVLYVLWRRSEGSSLTGRLSVPAEALREAPELEYGSILVPVFGRPLDDDIVGTAGRLAADGAEQGEGGPMIEALYVLEVPMSLPIDARLPDEQVARAKRALARAKEVGEEYEAVEVATTRVRGRSQGAAIVYEARRRGVQLIVLAAEEPTRVRGGGRLGGRGTAADRFIGETTRYVVEKAPCRVILTAPASDDARPEPAPEEEPATGSAKGPDAEQNGGTAARPLDRGESRRR